jgi:cation diffusion facilitator family transporter
LLGLSLRHSRSPPDTLHPFGYGRARFLWAFIAAMFTFIVGGCVSIALAITDLEAGGEVDHVLVAGFVLIVAAVADGTSLSQTLRQARREARSWGLPTIAYLRDTSDPTLRALAVEDGAALMGVGLAAGGLLVPVLGGPAAADAIASLLIGVLLAGTAVALARPLVDLLLGRSIAPGRLELAHTILGEAPGIDEVLALYAVHIGPDEAILTAKVHPTPGQSADELARLLDGLDERLRGELPEIGEVFIDVTAHSRPPDIGSRPHS